LQSAFIELIDEDGGDPEFAQYRMLNGIGQRIRGCALRTIFFRAGQYRAARATATKPIGRPVPAATAW
jgi:hypothetical protein